MSQRPAIQTVINPKPAKGHFVKLTSRKISVEFYIYRLQLNLRYIFNLFYLVLTHFLDIEEGMQPGFVVFPREP